MKKRKLNLVLGSAVVAPMTFLAASCGKEVETAEYLKQQKYFEDRARVDELEAAWKLFTLASLYNIEFGENISETEVKAKFNEEFSDETSKLYKDSYNAYKFWAKNKLKEDVNYFVARFTDWNENNYFDKTLLWVDTSKFPGEDEKTTEYFKEIWKKDETGIRDEINNMLLVKKYFDISDYDQIEKIQKELSYSKEFTYHANGQDVKFSLDHYFLNKHAINNKYVQIWQRDFDEKSKDSNAIFTEAEFDDKITNLDSFNAFFKDKPEANNKIKDFEILTTGENSKVEQKLGGFKGFIKDPGSYNLNWVIEDNLKRKTNEQTFGIYNPVTKNLISFAEIEKDKDAAVPIADADGKNHVIYINQIVPISAEDEVEVAANSTVLEKDKAEWEEKDKKKVSVLSFEKTIFKNNLDKLAYMFYLQDSKTLLETAIKSFAALGYKIEVNEEIKSLYDAVKEKPWAKVKVEDKDSKDADGKD